MANNVSAEKLVIFECKGGTFVTVYAAGRVKSGGTTGLMFDSTKGDPNVGCNGELLAVSAWNRKKKVVHSLWPAQIQSQHCQILTHC